MSKKGSRLLWLWMAVLVLCTSCLIPLTVQRGEAAYGLTNGYGTLDSFTTQQAKKDVFLSNLTVSAGSLLPLDPEFHRDITDYTVRLTEQAASVNITPTADDSRDAITVNGLPHTSGTAKPIPIQSGKTTVSIGVIAPDGKTQQTYRVTILAPAAALDISRSARPEVIKLGETVTVDYVVTPAPIRAEWLADRFPTEVSGIRPFFLLNHTYHDQLYDLEAELMKLEGKGNDNNGGLALGGAGKDNFREKMVSGYTGKVAVDQTLVTEPSAKRSDILAAVSDLIQRGVTEITIPLVDESQLTEDLRGRDSIRVDGFATFTPLLVNQKVMLRYQAAALAPSSYTLAPVTFQERLPANLGIVGISPAWRFERQADTITMPVPAITYHKQGEVYTADPLRFSITYKPEQAGVYLLQDAALTYRENAAFTITKRFDPLALRVENAPPSTVLYRLYYDSAKTMEVEEYNAWQGRNVWVELIFPPGVARTYTLDGDQRTYTGRFEVSKEGITAIGFTETADKHVVKTVKIDKAPPEKPHITGEALPAQKGIGNITIASADRGAGVDYIEYWTSLSSTPVRYTGPFSSPVLDVEQHTFTVYARAYDRTGKASEVAEHTFALDILPPVIVPPREGFIEQEDGAVGKLKLTAHVSDSGSGVDDTKVAYTVYLVEKTGDKRQVKAGSLRQVSGSTYTADVQLDQDKPAVYRVVITAIDKVGNKTVETDLNADYFLISPGYTLSQQPIVVGNPNQMKRVKQLNGRAVTFSNAPLKVKLQKNGDSYFTVHPKAQDQRELFTLWAQLKGNFGSLQQLQWGVRKVEYRITELNADLSVRREYPWTPLKETGFVIMKDGTYRVAFQITDSYEMWGAKPVSNLYELEQIIEINSKLKRF